MCSPSSPAFGARAARCHLSAPPAFEQQTRGVLLIPRDRCELGQRRRRGRNGTRAGLASMTMTCGSTSENRSILSQVKGPEFSPWATFRAEFPRTTRQDTIEKGVRSRELAYRGFFFALRILLVRIARRIKLLGYNIKIGGC